MRVRNDPVTAVVAGISAVASVAGGFSNAGTAQSQGAWARDQGIYERDYQNWQAEREKIALARDMDAAKRERSQTLSRIRAVTAVQGGGADPDYEAAQSGLFAINETSLIQDSEARQMSLRTKAGRAAQQGEFYYDQAQRKAGNEITKGIAGAFQPLGTLYKEAKKI